MDSLKEKDGMLIKIYAPIQSDLEEVEKKLATSLDSLSSLFSDDIREVLLSSGGKRIRAALVLLSAGIFGDDDFSKEEKDLLYHLSAGIELIHIASLIHDDIIDEASLRHHIPTVNYRWQNNSAIILGDYLYASAFKLLARCEDSFLLDTVAFATTMMCRGEIMQLKARKRMDISEDEYLSFIKDKTASLFASACKLGASFALLRRKNKKGKASFGRDNLKLMESYGLNLGMAFQIIDDYIDIMGDASIGKNLAQDITLGEFTLPLIYLWIKLDRRQRSAFKELLEGFKKEYISSQERKLSLANNGKLDKIKEELEKYGVTDSIKEKVTEFLSLAQKNLKIFSPSSYKDSLEDLLIYVYKRGFS